MKIQIIFENNWYSDIEKDKIKYQKRSLIVMREEAYEPKNENFTEIYNKP